MYLNSKHIFGSVIFHIPFIIIHLSHSILRGEFKEEDTVLIDTDVGVFSNGQLPQQKLVFKRLASDSDTAASENREAVSQQTI